MGPGMHCAFTLSVTSIGTFLREVYQPCPQPCLQPCPDLNPVLNPVPTSTMCNTFPTSTDQQQSRPPPDQQQSRPPIQARSNTEGMRLGTTFRHEVLMMHITRFTGRRCDAQHPFHWSASSPCYSPCSDLNDVKSGQRCVTTMCINVEECVKNGTKKRRSCLRTGQF